jgi:hypothetical protein
VQRWEVEHPDAPDGIAIIGSDAAGGGYLQHYLDSRGVARVYEMTFADNVWTLERDVAARDFSQRFTGTFDDDRNVIVGHWESSSDGSNWKPDFDLTYTRTHSSAEDCRGALPPAESSAGSVAPSGGQ